MRQFSVSFSSVYVYSVKGICSIQQSTEERDEWNGLVWVRNQPGDR